KQPEVSNIGNGVFSIDGLMDSQPAPALSIVDQARQRAAEEKLHPANSGETTSDVQMEKTQPEKVENTDPVHPGEGTDAADTQAVTVAQEEQKAEPVIEYPAYFEPGRYEGLPNDIYHAANGISSTQVKDARVSLMYFNARHVAKTIPRTASKVLDMGNLVHALALQPENL
ncbi:exodeoxyribonuclease, partial [Enterobacter cloacae complex sp. 743-2DZ2F-22B]